MSIFSHLYNSVTKFFRSQDETEDASKSVATNRLKLVLMQDRTNLTPKILEQMRSELIELLSRYVELDKDLLDLNFEQEGNQVALMLSIPVIRAKDEDEIEAAIKRHKEAVEKLNSIIVETNDEENSEEITSEEKNETESDIQPEIENTNAEKTEISELSEEEKIEAKKADAIAEELTNVPKIIKKNKVSTPEEISNNNPFKPEELDKKIESSTEA
jgi:cell division topological specificity factor